MKKAFFWAILIVGPMFLLILIGELVGSFYLAGHRPYQYDQVLGWVPKPNFHYRRNHIDNAGHEYLVEASTNEHGFRAWGDITSERTKILFVGDSFTGDLNMSDTDSYYGYVAENVDAEVFAIGAGGYGTLQELMLVRKFYHIINPDLLILQFCSNDFQNNSYELEANTIVRNQKNLRPYLVRGEVVYRVPDNHWYKVLYRNSDIFRTLDGMLQKFQFNKFGGYAYPVDESELDEQARKQQSLEADRTTEQLLRMMADEFSEQTELLTFICNTRSAGATERWERVVIAAGFRPLAGVSIAVEQAEDEGAIVRGADAAHWGPLGHRLAGMELVREISNNIAGPLGSGLNGSFFGAGASPEG